MKLFFQIIRFDYLQRIRNYNFLITLCFSIIFAYSFVPDYNSNYSTIRIGGYIGNYNSAWFSFVTAMMTSSFLSFIGFYLVSSSISYDITSRVGLITAVTKTSNYRYLLSKTFSNFLILLTIVFVIFFSSMFLFVYRDNGNDFELILFVKAYSFITIPAIFFISSIAVVFEVMFASKSILQNIIFSILFGFILAFPANSKLGFALDFTGTKIVTQSMVKNLEVNNLTSDSVSPSIGYSSIKISELKRFDFNETDLPMSFLLSRVFWIIISILFISGTSKLFHRFSTKENKVGKKKKIFSFSDSNKNEIELNKLSSPKINYSILPLIKTEFILILRKSKKWLLLVNVLLMIALAFSSMKLAHQIILPILWFLQVSRISDITTKEASSKIEYLVNTSYKPMQRLFTAQLLSSFSLMLLLSLPLLIRYAILLDTVSITAIVLGALLIIIMSAFIGLVTKGKKLFEIVFFLITYANVNKVHHLDYFGAINNNIVTIALMLFVLIFSTILIKRSRL